MSLPIKTLCLLPVFLILAACAAPVKEPAPSGFLRNYDALQPAGDKHLQTLNPDLARYHQFVIDRPIVLYEAAEGGDQFTDKELESLKDHIGEQFREQVSLKEPFEVVEGPGPDVARIRFVVTDLNATDGLLNVSVLTKVTGAGLGGIAMEMEVSDSQTGKELLAAIRWGTGSRVLRAGFTRLGDAKIQVNRWARDLRQQLEQLAP